MILIISDDSEFEASQLGNQPLLLFHKIGVGTRNNDFDAIITNTSNGNFFRTRRIDSFRDCRDHLVDRCDGNRFAGFLFLLTLGRFVINAVDEVCPPGQVDA